MQKLRIIFYHAGVLLMALLVYIVLEISKDGPYLGASMPRSCLSLSPKLEGVLCTCSQISFDYNCGTD